VRTAVDSSVLLDVLIADPRFVEPSEQSLRRAAGEGALLLCECVLAEITPVVGASAIDEFLADWNLAFVPSTIASAKLAGEMYQILLATQYPTGPAGGSGFFSSAPTPCVWPIGCWLGIEATTETTSSGSAWSNPRWDASSTGDA